MRTGLHREPRARRRRRGVGIVLRLLVLVAVVGLQDRVHGDAVMAAARRPPASGSRRRAEITPRVRSSSVIDRALRRFRPGGGIYRRDASLREPVLSLDAYRWLTAARRLPGPREAFGALHARAYRAGSSSVERADRALQSPSRRGRGSRVEAWCAAVDSACGRRAGQVGTFRTRFGARTNESVRRARWSAPVNVSGIERATRARAKKTARASPFPSRASPAPSPPPARADAAALGHRHWRAAFGRFHRDVDPDVQELIERPRS